jgi:hypothetical protein
MRNTYETITIIRQTEQFHFLPRPSVQITDRGCPSCSLCGPRQSAFTLTQSPKIIAKIRQERNKVYQTELASTAVQTLKEVMEDTDAPASARIAVARTSLELAGVIGKHLQSQRNI